MRRRSGRQRRSPRHARSVPTTGSRCTAGRSVRAGSGLGENWPGAFVVGHGMDADLLRSAGIEESDAVVVATDGDNTNIVISQVAQKRFGIECVVARLLDPARADFYAARGLRTVC